MLTPFPIEAVVLSIAGGLIGIALSAAGARLLSPPFAPDPRVILPTFGFSAAVSDVFGFVPARRAARMNPIDALHHQ